MLEIIQFIFSSPWVYFGSLVYIVVVTMALGMVVSAIVSK